MHLHYISAYINPKLKLYKKAELVNTITALCMYPSGCDSSYLYEQYYRWTWVGPRTFNVLLNVKYLLDLSFLCAWHCRCACIHVYAYTLVCCPSSFRDLVANDPLAIYWCVVLTCFENVLYIFILIISYQSDTILIFANLYNGIFISPPLHSPEIISRFHAFSFHSQWWIDFLFNIIQFFVSVCSVLVTYSILCYLYIYYNWRLPFIRMHSL